MPVATGVILGHFHRDEPLTMRGILHDLLESGLVSGSGTGDATVFAPWAKRRLATLAPETGRAGTIS